jgi:biotin carboxyl carrier protein
VLARILLLWGACCLAARAQAPVTIQQAVKEALERNVELLAQRYEIPIAEARLLQARLRPNPRLGVETNFLDLLGANYIPEEGPTGPAETNTVVYWEIETAGKRRVRMQTAREALASARETFLDARRTLALEVQSAFLDTVLAKENGATLREVLETFENVVKVNRTRFEAGDIARVELLRSEVAALQFRNQLRQAELRVRQEAVRLQRLMGRPAPARLEFNPNSIFRVVLPAPGRVAEVFVYFGDAVQRGDSLLSLETPEADLAAADYSRAGLARYGVRVRDLQELIELAIGGRTVSTLYDGDRRFDITVRYLPEARADAGAIASILVPTRSGARVPLGQLADVRITDGESIIARSENRRMVSVRTNIRGRDQGGFAAELRRRVEREVPLPEGYRVEWGGQFENMTRAKARLSVALPVTVFLIFVLLFFAFRSTRDSLVVMLTVPFSFVGGIGLLWLRGINLSVSAAVGFVSLFGVAVMSGVLILSEVNRRRRQPGVDLLATLIDGCVAQMRPVLMMVVVAMLGMIPAARATGIGSDVQRPLATVVVGGLASTLVLTFVGLPALYYVVARRRAAKM